MDGDWYFVILSPDCDPSYNHPIVIACVDFISLNKFSSVNDESEIKDKKSRGAGTEFAVVLAARQENLGSLI